MDFSSCAPVFRPAADADRTALLSLYTAVRGSEFCTWDEVYPGMEEIEADLAGGGLFLLADGASLLGAVSVVSENELDGLDLWLLREGAFEIARVAVAPAAQGRGFGGQLVREAEAVLRARGGRAVHLLAAQVNLPACRVYRRAGYQLRGSCEMFGGSYLAMEKAL